MGDNLLLQAHEKFQSDIGVRNMHASIIMTQGLYQSQH